MELKKKIDFEALTLVLLNEKGSVNITDIANAAGLPKTSADRRAIQRTLAKLIAAGIIRARGKARARIYLLNNLSADNSKVIQADEKIGSFQGVTLSESAQKLLQYISKAIQIRKPVSYNQDFLRSYLPNKTSYLSARKWNVF